MCSRSSRTWSTFTLLGAIASCWAALPSWPLDDPQSKPVLHQLRIEDFSASILSFDIAHGTDLAAVALNNLQVRVWRLDTGEQVHAISFQEPATDKSLRLDNEVEPITLHFSPDGRTLAVGFVNAIYLFDLRTWKEEKSLVLVGEDRLRPGILPTPPTPELQHRSAEQARVQTKEPPKDINQTMREWAREQAKGDGRTRIRDFAFAPGGDFILVAYCRGDCWAGPKIERVAFPTGDDPVRLWDLRSTGIVWQRSFDPEGVISRIVFLPDSAQFIGVNSHLGHCAVGGYQLSDGRQLGSQAMGPCLYPPNIVVLPQGKEFITNRSSESNLKNRKKRLWRDAALYSVADGKKIVDLPDHDGMGAAAVSSDGHWLILSIWLGIQFHVWDMQENKVILRDVPRGWKRTEDNILDIVDLTSDNRWLVVGSSGIGRLAIYSFGHGE